MEKELFNEILQSAREAASIERGAIKPSRKFEVKTANNVVRVRNKARIATNQVRKAARRH